MRVIRFSLWDATRLTLFGVLLCGIATSAWSAPDADALIRKSNQAIKANTEYTRMQMDLLDPQGAVEQTRSLEVYFKHYSDHEVTLQKFLAPPIIQGSGLLIVDHYTPVNDIWMYLPTTRRLRRIAGAEKSNRYMGTEFSYEDFEDYQTQSYRFDLLKQKPCMTDRHCTLVVATPATDEERGASNYGKKIYWIESISLYPVRVDYYDKQDKLIKTLNVTKLAKYGHYWLPVDLFMENQLNQRRTRVLTLERRVDKPMDDRFLSKRYLRTE